MHNISEDNETLQKDRSKLYYLPAINRDDSVCIGGNLAEGEKFQLANFNNDSRVYNKPEKSKEITKDNIDNIEDRAREIEENAYAEGYKKGEKIGLESGRKKVEPILNKFCELLKEVSEIKESICRDAEKEVVNLALAIARKVVGFEADKNQEVVINVIKEALKSVADHGKIKIRINPADFKFLMEDGRRVRNFLEDPKRITFIEDSTIEVGGCFIESELGDVDARIEKQLQIIEEAFNSEYRGITSEKLGN